LNYINFFSEERHIVPWKETCAIHANNDPYYL